MSLAHALRTWGEMVKFSHSIFALPFALIAMMLAGRERPTGLPAVGQFALVVWCMITARSFAMTFNRVVDAAIDARNPRTATRPLPSGRITPSAAWAFMASAAILFVAGCAGFFAFANPWPFRLSLPVLVLLAAYSFTKRFTPYSHFILGMAIGSSPMAAWLAVDPDSLGWPAVLLSAAVAVWIAGFDVIYACQDASFDRQAGLFSLPSRWGVGPALWASRACHVLTIGLLVATGVSASLGTLYYVGVGGVAALLAYEQSLVRASDLSRVNLAFFTINGIVSLVFASAAIADVLIRRPAA